MRSTSSHAMARLTPVLFCAASALLGFQLSSVPSAWAGEDAPSTQNSGAGQELVLDREETIVIGGIPTIGQPMLPATETEFRLKLKLTGDVVVLRWDSLEESERKRLQKIYKLDTKGDVFVFGNKIKGVRLTLENGKVVEGLAIPERNQPGQKAIRTAATPLLRIPERDIRSSEEYEAFESEFYSPMEIYQRWLLERPPGPNDAAAHFSMSEECAKIRLYSKALEHLESACIIDSRMADRTADFKEQLIRSDADQQVQELFGRMVTLKRKPDYFGAWDILERLDRNFPQHDWRSRWESMRAEIEAGVKTDMTKRVIFLSYSVALDLVQEKFYKKIRTDEKGNEVPSIPGKQVVTRAGHAFRGTLVEGGEGGADMVLKVGDTELRIQGKDITSVRDVDLAKSFRDIEPTYEYLKEYVTSGGQDGLKGEMIKRISKLVKQPENKVKELFDGRLSKMATYKDGVYTADPTYVTQHDVNYGISSWLRDGSRPGPLPQNQNQQQPRGQRVRINGQNIQIQQQQQQIDPNDDPNTTDDPEIWWKAQSNDTKLNALKSLMVEKVFKVKQVDQYNCTKCSGQKNILVTGAGGNPELFRCPSCRGMGIMFKVGYW